MCSVEPPARDGAAPVWQPLAARIARRRVTLGFLFGAIVLWLAAPTRETLAVGVAVASLGEGLRVWAAGHINKAREVTASGPYRFIAHPLYAGSSIMGAGLAIASGRAIVAAVVLVYLAVAVGAAMTTEEGDLRRRFGERYESYRRPMAAAPASRDGASRRRFSLAQAFANGEHRALVGFLVAVLLLAWKATYNASFWQTVGARFIRPGG